MSTETDYFEEEDTPKTSEFNPGLICSISAVLALMVGFLMTMFGTLLLFDSPGNSTGMFWVTLGIALLAGPTFINVLSLSNNALMRKKWHFGMVGIAAVVAAGAAFVLAPRAPQTAAWLLVWCGFSVVVFLPWFEDWKPSTRWLHYWTLMALISCTALVLYGLHHWTPTLSAALTGTLMGTSVMLHGTAMWYLRRKHTPLGEEQNIDVWPYLLRGSHSPSAARAFNYAMFQMLFQMEGVTNATYAKLLWRLDDATCLAVLKRQNMMISWERETTTVARCVQAAQSMPLREALDYLNEPSYALIEDAVQNRLRNVHGLALPEALAYLRATSQDTRPQLDGFKLALREHISMLEPNAVAAFTLYKSDLDAIEAIEAIEHGQHTAKEEELLLPNLELAA